MSRAETEDQQEAARRKEFREEMEAARRGEAARQSEAKGKMEAAWKEKGYADSQRLKVTHYYLNVRKLLNKLSIPSDKTLFYHAKVAEQGGKLPEGFGRELNLNLKEGKEGGRISQKMRKERNKVRSLQPDVINPPAVHETTTSSAPVDPIMSPQALKARQEKFRGQFKKSKSE